jgi:hypothetical protein
MHSINVEIAALIIKARLDLREQQRVSDEETDRFETADSQRTAS